MKNQIESSNLMSNLGYQRKPDSEPKGGVFLVNGVNSVNGINRFNSVNMVYTHTHLSFYKGVNL